MCDAPSMMNNSFGSLAGNEADGHGFRMRTDNAVDDVRPVLVVLGVVGRVDCRVRVGCRVSEAHVALDTAGADTTGTARCGVPIPRAIRSACGTDIDLIAGAHDPHRRVRAQAAIRTRRCEVQFLSVADAVEVSVAPCGHQSDPARTSDPMARSGPSPTVIAPGLLKMAARMSLTRTSAAGDRESPLRG